MKTKYFLLTALMTTVLTTPMFGQVAHSDTTSTGMKQPDLSGMMGKPTADASVGGLHMKVWLMTQDEHRTIMKDKMGQMPMHSESEGEMGKMDVRGLDVTSMVMAKEMKGLSHDAMGRKDTSIGTANDTVEAIQGSRSMNKAMAGSKTAGTHYMVLDVTEIATGKEIAGAGARVLIESPSKKSSSVDLKSMMEHFGGAFTLDEKGEYHFTVNVSFGGVTKSTQFQYAVK